MTFSPLLTVGSKSQDHIPNLSYLEEKDKFIEKCFSQNRVFPLVYDIYLNEEDFLKKIMTIICLMKVDIMKDFS
jgi:hypothetical protein